MNDYNIIARINDKDFDTLYQSLFMVRKDYKILKYYIDNKKND